MTKQETIKDCLDNIDIYSAYEVEEILIDAGISLEEFKVAYDKEFN